MKTVFLYHNPRDRLLADVQAGTAPDTGLMGSNHLAELGIDASVQAPRMQVKHILSGETRYFREWSLLVAYLLAKVQAVDD